MRENATFLWCWSDSKMFSSRQETDECFLSLWHRELTETHSRWFCSWMHRQVNTAVPAWTCRRRLTAALSTAAETRNNSHVRQLIHKETVVCPCHMHEGTVVCLHHMREETVVCPSPGAWRDYGMPMWWCPCHYACSIVFWGNKDTLKSDSGKDSWRCKCTKWHGYTRTPYT